MRDAVGGADIHGLDAEQQIEDRDEHAGDAERIAIDQLDSLSIDSPRHTTAPRYIN